MAMDQYLYIPFLGGWTSIYQLFWCSPGVQGFDTLPYLQTILCKQKMSPSRSLWPRTESEAPSCWCLRPAVVLQRFSHEGMINEFRKPWWSTSETVTKWDECPMSKYRPRKKTCFPCGNRGEQSLRKDLSGKIYCDTLKPSLLLLLQPGEARCTKKIGQFSGHISGQKSSIG